MKASRQMRRFKRTISYLFLFWPTALVIALGKLLIRLSDTPAGRFTLRPVLRILTRWILYARSLPILRNQNPAQALPTNALHQLIARAPHIAALPCACRATRHKCSNPLHKAHNGEVCLGFGLTAILQELSGLGRRITAEEALRLCETSAQTGLVHHAILSFGMLTEVCNCCEETCSVILAHRRGIENVVRPSGWVPMPGPDCDDCQDRPGRICVEICPYGEGPGSETCMGCGLCAYHCPNHAIKMVNRNSLLE
jgi:hypothetical protein